jgi:serine/threonine-protein kinase RsbW
MRREFALSSAGMTAAFDFIAETVARRGLDAAVAHRLSVIVDEVCANVIRHDRSLAEADRFTLELTEDGDSMVMVISDAGRPFNPLSHRPAAPVDLGGHGLELIRGLASRIDYERAGARNRLTVSIAAQG